MNYERDQPKSDSADSYRRIREALRIEKDRRWGEVGKIEADLGYSPGYLAKICRGQESIKVDRLLRLLHRMEIDPGRFFANALDARPNNDSLLEEIERFGKIEPRLAQIEKLIREVESSEISDLTPPTTDPSALVADLATCKGREQRRRLGNARKYRHPAFAAAYLEHLDSLRYSNANEARLSSLAVAVKLIPVLPAPRQERIKLLLKAIGVYASCNRQQGKFATAARAFRLALSLSRRQELKEATAELLQRAAYLFTDNGRYSAAIELLDEAIIICVDLDLQVVLGTIMVDRGSALYNLGEYEESIQAISRALGLLQGDSPRIRRNRLVAYQALSRDHQALGDLEQADLALEKAVAESDPAEELHRAYLVWDYGVIALARHSYDLAESRLRTALEMFERMKDRNKAMVALDLIKALKVQGKSLEAMEMATGMAQYLMSYRGNQVAEASICDLIQTAFEGRLTIEAIERVQVSLASVQNHSRR